MPQTLHTLWHRTNKFRQCESRVLSVGALVQSLCLLASEGESSGNYIWNSNIVWGADVNKPHLKSNASGPEQSRLWIKQAASAKLGKNVAQQ